MRDKAFTITKAIAIILVVLSHAGAPSWVNHFIYQFHVPVFFICAGYFFNLRYLDDTRTYVTHRIKGLYLPFLRWSLLFLLLHNLLFFIGLLSEQYGNPEGGVLHPYSWGEFSQRLWSITFNMSGYDEFLGGTFWFFRALLLSSLAFLVLFKLIRHLRPAESEEHVAGIILGIAILLGLWQTGGELRITGVAQSGYREITGVALMSIGFLIHRYRETIPWRWYVGIGGAALCALGAWAYPVSMGWKGTPGSFLMLLPMSVAGFSAIYYLSQKVEQMGGIIARGLCYIGDRTLYVFAFHLAAFKLVSIIKVAVYGLPWEAVGGHTVVNFHRDDAFWVFYLLVGVSVPLAWQAGYRRLATRYDFSLPGCLRGLLKFSIVIIRLTVIGIKCFGVWLWKTIRGSVAAAKEIINASNPKDE